MMDDGSSTACLPADAENTCMVDVRSLSCLSASLLHCIALHAPLLYFLVYPRVVDLDRESYGRRGHTDRPTDRPISIEDDEGHLGDRLRSGSMHAAAGRAPALSAAQI